MKKIVSVFIAIVFIFNGCVEKKTSVNYIINRDYPIYSICDFPQDLILLDNLNVRNNDILVNLFEGLVKKNLQGDIIPALAESWQINNNNTIYTFKIRDDINWSNGDKITSKDFVSFFSEILNSSTNNIFDYQLFYIFGAENYRKGKVDFNKTAIRSINDELLEIRLNAPCNYLLDILSNPIYSLRKIDDNLKNWVFNYEKILFSGAYKIKFIKGEEMELEKNIYYWDKDNVVSKKVVIVNNKNSESSLAAFQSSKADFTISPPLSEIKALKAKGNIAEIPSNSNKALVFNFSSDKIKNKELRTAINKCINRKKICNDILENTAEPWEFSISDNKSSANKNTILYKDNDSMNNLKLLCDNSLENKRVIEEVKKELKENLGIDIQVIVYENNDFVNKLREKKYDLALIDWEREYKNSLNYYEKFLMDNYFNFFSYKNLEYNNVIYKAKMETNEIKQKELFKKADKIIINDLPIIPLYTKKSVICKNECVYNIEMNYNGNILLGKLYYSPILK